MATLAELKEKYRLQGGKYEPNPDCKFCKGNGERLVAKLNQTTFCICLFVAPDMSDFAGESLAKTARKIRMEMEGITEQDAADTEYGIPGDVHMGGFQ